MGAQFLKLFKSRAQAQVTCIQRHRSLESLDLIS